MEGCEGRLCLPPGMRPCLPCLLAPLPYYTLPALPTCLPADVLQVLYEVHRHDCRPGELAAACPELVPGASWDYGEAHSGTDGHFLVTLN